MINKIVKALVLLVAVVFLVNGLRWIVNPSGIVGMFGFELSSGVGLSSQVGDMSAYFLTLSICLLLGLVTRVRIWFYPPILLLGLTAVGRILAWMVHDAAFAADLILAELLICIVVWLASIKSES